MRHRQAPLGHHLHQVAQTELEAKIPAHAQDDDFAVAVATLEQLRYRLQLAHRRPQPVQHANVADRTPPFAPEPLIFRQFRHHSCSGSVGFYTVGRPRRIDMPRASWRGYLRLSLVSCPIYLTPATTRTKSIRLHQVWRPIAAEEPDDF